MRGLYWLGSAIAFLGWFVSTNIILSVVLIIVGFVILGLGVAGETRKEQNAK